MANTQENIEDSKPTVSSKKKTDKEEFARNITLATVLLVNGEKQSSVL